MGEVIVVPPGEEGDKALMRMIPHLHEMAKAEQNKRRSNG